MWGAGQMMFNKILVIADEGTPITNYLQLAQYVFKNLNPVTDIYFSQGPMDVLDHSCSKLGFGGKMCIDGTRKFDEENDDRFHWEKPDQQGIEGALQSSFPELKKVNTSLLAKDIPCLVLSIEKNRKGHIKDLHEKIAALPALRGIKMILYVEHTVDANDLAIALWRFCNNLDPKRDYHLYSNNGTACMGLDGTRKTKELDDFHRDWPNIIVADDATIDSVDAKWNSLNIGKFIPSPSLKFKGQMYGSEAVVS